MLTGIFFLLTPLYIKHIACKEVTRLLQLFDSVSHHTKLLFMTVQELFVYYLLALLGRDTLITGEGITFRR